jgi:hypothetical protein
MLQKVLPRNSTAFKFCFKDNVRLAIADSVDWDASIGTFIGKRQDWRRIHRNPPTPPEESDH